MGISIDEKRVYDASEGPTPVFVAGEFGVARVDTSDDLAGEFGLARDCVARDAAGRDGRLAVATDEDVLVGVFGDEGSDGDPDRGGATDGTSFESLGVGPAVAVGFADGGELVVAREDGRVLRGRDGRDDGDDGSDGDDEDGESGRDDGSDGDGAWTELGDLADVRAADGNLLAAASGVYRATGEDLRHVGLDDARDVSAGGAPLAATGEGLYGLANGWTDELSGDFRAVSAAPASESGEAGATGWAHAAGSDGLFAREDGEWREVALPAAGEVVAVDHGEAGAYAATAEGTFLLSVGDGWNHQTLGLRGVRAVAAP